MLSGKIAHLKSWKKTTVIQMYKLGDVKTKKNVKQWL